MKGILIWSVKKFFSVIYVLIFINVMLSWLRISPYNSIVNIIYQLTEPILEPFRRLMDRTGLNTGMIDFSPLIAYLVLQLIETSLINILWAL
ncbi:YggT family protein [Lutispora thermophila DSM 19022]|uniref:YggT family protein n=1 Tax=Lutispora thermophila DSM 19022 TaxID=1122184 RepID=A0A1M6G2B8_9FIRM|nr:YggT family protein [Lutispora thermophila DSM 19022]